jgi:acetoin utilization protein AcuB
MEAKGLMTKKLITVNAETPMQKAYDVMKKNNIRHLPVVDMNGRLAGMISDRDLKLATHIKKISEIETELTFDPKDMVEDYMSWPVQTVDEKTPLDQVAQMMVEEKVSALIVNAPNHYMKGIITSDDLLLYLVEILTTSEKVERVPLSNMMWRADD